RAGFGSFGLGSMPGFTCEFISSLTPRIEYWPGLVEQTECMHHIVLDDGAKRRIALPEMAADAATSGEAAKTKSDDLSRFGPTTRAPLGAIAHARSGDK